MNCNNGEEHPTLTAWLKAKTNSYPPPKSYSKLQRIEVAFGRNADDLREND